jgi:hypothetical protein
MRRRSVLKGAALLGGTLVPPRGIQLPLMQKMMIPPGGREVEEAGHNQLLDQMNPQTRILVATKWYVQDT